MQNATKRLYFGRDPLGRRSLVIRRPTADNPLLLLASVSYGYDSSYDFEELSTDSIYCLDVDSLVYDSVCIFPLLLTPSHLLITLTLGQMDLPIIQKTTKGYRKRPTISLRASQLFCA